jgi:glyoxalase family protein
VLSVREIPETERFFVEALGFKKTGQEGNYLRLELNGGGANRTIILQHEPDRPSGSWTFGAGTGHHVALDAGSDEGLAEQKGIYEELGYTDCSEIKDRNYFHSIYCRCPGGILVECAATAAGGFSRDEPSDALGHKLLLPPWFEERRAEIMTMLEPITIPENNFPVHLEAVAVKTATPGGTPAAAEPVSTGASRRQAVFIGGDGGQKKQ